MPNRDEKRYKLLKLRGGEVLSTQYFPTFQEVIQEVIKVKRATPGFIRNHDIWIYNQENNKEWGVDLEYKLVEM